MSSNSTPDYQAIAKQVFTIEAEAIAHLSSQLTKDFDLSVHAILKTKGRVVICGMGKSGLIGTKIMATFASTGTPCFSCTLAKPFMVTWVWCRPIDVFLALSNSGETER